MKYILTENNTVQYGPRDWNKKLFQSELSDLEVTYTLPQEAPLTKLSINGTYAIYPVTYTDEPAYDPKIQQLAGPFFAFDSTNAVGVFEVADKNIDAVKNELKAAAAATRWGKEVSGVTATIQGKEVTLDTTREGRNIYLQAAQLGSNNDQWKFKDVWLTLTTAEIQQVVAAVMAHVQTCFAWEGTKTAAIDACTTLEQLSSIQTDNI